MLFPSQTTDSRQNGKRTTNLIHWSQKQITVNWNELLWTRTVPFIPQNKETHIRERNENCEQKEGPIAFSKIIYVVRPRRFQRRQNKSWGEFWEPERKKHEENRVTCNYRYEIRFSLSAHFVTILKWLCHKEDNHLLIFCVFSRDCSSNISRKNKLENVWEYFKN